MLTEIIAGVLCWQEILRSRCVPTKNRVFTEMFAGVLCRQVIEESSVDRDVCRCVVLAGNKASGVGRDVCRCVVSAGNRRIKC